MKYRTVIVLVCHALALLAQGKEAEAPSRFFRAVARGDLAEITQGLDQGVSANARDESGANALYLACDKEQSAAARLLIERGADVNLTPPHHSTALQVSIYRGFDAYNLKPKPGWPGLIRLLLDKGADVNAPDLEGNTPLIAAAEKDDVATLTLLLQRGADLTRTNKNGWTALERAVTYRRRTIAHALVAAGAPLDTDQQRTLRDYQFARRSGAWFPVILIGSFALAAWMRKRFNDLPKRTSPPREGDDLPKLQTLKCAACGGSASLRPGKASCSHCHQPVLVPDDYLETLKLRARSFKLMEKAVTLWRRARLISSWPVRLLLWATAIWFVWRMAGGIFPHFSRDAFYNFMTFRGTMVWALDALAMTAVAIALVGYAIYLALVRDEVPAPPAAVPRLGVAEDVCCSNCGGIVAFQPGDLASICGYCGSEAYRVALARNAHSAAVEGKDEAALSLYQAMLRVYELRETAALAVPLAIIAIGLGLVVLLRIVLIFV